MPQAVTYQKSQHSDYERLQVENEKDVLQTKLDAEVNSIMDELLGNHTEHSLYKNPLLRDTYKTLNQSEAESNPIP